MSGTKSVDYAKLYNEIKGKNHKLLTKGDFVRFLKKYDTVSTSYEEKDRDGHVLSYNSDDADASKHYWYYKKDDQEIKVEYADIVTHWTVTEGAKDNLLSSKRYAGRDFASAEKVPGELEKANQKLHVDLGYFMGKDESEGDIDKLADGLMRSVRDTNHLGKGKKAIPKTVTFKQFKTMIEHYKDSFKKPHHKKHKPHS
jgi:hypothetical protein